MDSTNSVVNRTKFVPQTSKSADLSGLGNRERDCLSEAKARPHGPSERERESQSQVSKPANLRHVYAPSFSIRPQERIATNPPIHQSTNPAAVAAVIPCFNEALTIRPLVLDLRRNLELVVVVDDGSTDHTALNAEHAGAMVLRHYQNRGKGAALRTGLSQVHNLGCKWAVTMDGDGQHDPADLPALLRCAEQTDAPLVIGNRMDSATEMPWLRRHVNRWMSKTLSQFAGRRLPDTQSGFRLIHLQTWAELSVNAQRFEVESEMLMAFLAASHPVEFVPIRVIPAARKSRIHPVTDTLRWLRWWQQLRKSSKRIATIESDIPPNELCRVRATSFPKFSPKIFRALSPRTAVIHQHFKPSADNSPSPSGRGPG